MCCRWDISDSVFARCFAVAVVMFRVSGGLFCEGSPLGPIDTLLATSLCRDARAFSDVGLCALSGSPACVSACVCVCAVALRVCLSLRGEGCLRECVGFLLAIVRACCCLRVLGGAPSWVLALAWVLLLTRVCGCFYLRGCVRVNVREAVSWFASDRLQADLSHFGSTCTYKEGGSTPPGLAVAERSYCSRGWPLTRKNRNSYYARCDIPGMQYVC